MQFPSDAARVNDLASLAWLSSSDEPGKLVTHYVEITDKKQSLKLLFCDELAWASVAVEFVGKNFLG